MPGDEKLKEGFNLPNLEFIQNLYQEYKKHPDKINLSWRQYFLEMEEFDIRLLENDITEPEKNTFIEEKTSSIQPQAKIVLKKTILEEKTSSPKTTQAT